MDRKFPLLEDSKTEFYRPFAILVVFNRHPTQMMLYIYLHKVWENKMDVQSKLQKLKKRLGLTAALSIAAMSASSAEQQDSIKNTAFPAAKETKVNTFT